MKVGLVLEGGAMQCLFTAGVIDYLMQKKINFTGVVGVSAGACFGVNYKSHQPGRTLRYNLNFAGNPRYASWRSWFKSGNLYGANFCYHILPNEFDKFDKKTFNTNEMEFWSVSTDAYTGKPNYHLMKNCNYTDLEWIRASASISVDFAQEHYDKNEIRRVYQIGWQTAASQIEQLQNFLKSDNN